MVTASGERTRNRVRDRLVELAGAGLDVASFWRGATAELERALDFDWRPCWFTLDPESRVLTSHVNEDLESLDAAVLHNEYVEDDVNKMADLALRGEDVATLDRATGGEPTRSARYRDLFGSYGIRHELVAILRSGPVAWGSVTLYRFEGRSDFDDADLAFVRSLGPVLAEGARRGLLRGEIADDGARPASPVGGPGVVVLDASGRVRSATADGSRWLSHLGGDDVRVPEAVLAVAAAARAPHWESAASARVRTRSGAWVRLHASPIDAEGVAVVIEPVAHDQLGSLLMAAYALTDRERDVTREILRGHDTATIAATLHLSPHTVQDHLKSIFAKTGTGSRRELLAAVFFGAFEPRVRDNEERVPAGRAIRGGPLPRRT